MWRLIARPLDRFAIRSACGSVLPSADGHSHAEGAAAFLNRPDFFAPHVSPAELKFTSQTSFEFPSQFHSSYSANNLVRGRCELTRGEWQQRPSVILLHGWNASLQYQWQFPYWSQLLANAGVNAFAFELPHHMSRTPTEPGAIRNFLSGDLLHVMRTTHQALADIRALALWLRAQGSPAVGVWGVSLGAWLSALAGAHQPELDATALLTPVVRMDRALKELAFFDPIREHLSGVEERFRALDLFVHPPPCHGRVLIVAGKLDLFVPLETIDELERAWNAEAWRFAHGHISVLMSRRIIYRIVNWLSRTLAEAVSRPRTAKEKAVTTH